MPRPVAVGYVRLPEGLGVEQATWLVRQWREALGDVAIGEGHAPGEVFTDVAPEDESGPYALITYLRAARATAVVTPSLRHLTRGAYLVGADRLTAARFLRAPVLTVEHAASRRSGTRPSLAVTPRSRANGPAASVHIPGRHRARGEG
jgi:hypothetical protein